jgi:glycosyltransferase involved in cell wall biosynthesis
LCEDGVHGTIVPAGDAAALSAAIVALIANPARRHWPRSAWTVERNLSFAQRVRALDDIYRR